MIRSLKMLASRGVVWGVAAGLVALSAAPALANDGKKVFSDSKCAQCHSVDSEKIPADEKDGAVDLSGIGAKHDAAWLRGYLLKKEAKNGKKHKKKFNGSDADLDTLVKWLASLK